MQLKQYQQEALDALRDFLEVTRATNNAKNSFEKVTQKLTLGRYEGIYSPLEAMPDVPYVCIRIPTGGGKTILGAHAVKLAGESFLERDYPLALWLVPSNIIRRQTVEALKDPRHPYRQVLDAAFEGRVRVFDIADFTQIRPVDLRDNVCVVVGTIQTLRVQNTEGRKVYAYHDDMEAHFASRRRLPEGLERDKKGRIKSSFANLLYLNHPLMIVDEAHNAVTGLTREMQTRLNPACIVEFTATPRPHSNVLFSVSASVLKDAEMIKLPVLLTAHSSWQGAVNGALMERERLAKEAEKEAQYLRPLVLFQAQNKDQEVHADILKQHLIENENVAAGKIAIATGDQRDLDNIDLFDPKCPIEYVITVEALKEGWDCSFAYVFCSLANIRSATAVEQLLGRVLRMPYANRRHCEALNRAYAHVCETDFVQAAVQLRDRLVDMGFESEEADDNIRMPSLSLDGGAAASLAPPVVEFELVGAEAAEVMPASVRDAVEITHRDGKTVARILRPLNKADEDAVVALATPGGQADVRKELAYQRMWVERQSAPAARGETFSIPQLCYREQGELRLAEPEFFLHLGGWHLLDYEATLKSAEFSPDEGYQKFQLDVEKKSGKDQVIYNFESDTMREEPELEGLITTWDDKTLCRWLDKECRMPDVRQQERLEFIRRIVQEQLDRKIPLPVLVYSKYRLTMAIKRKIADCRTQAETNNYQSCLFAPDAPVEASFDYAFDFKSDRYPARWFYSGSYKFNRHFYHRVGELKSDGEEFECARALDMIPQVRYWVRNIERGEEASFRLPRAHGWFYPDFVALLEDGRLLIVEYKGEQLIDKASEKEKANVGALWEAHSQDKGLFLVVEKTRSGLRMGEQIKKKI